MIKQLVFFLCLIAPRIGASTFVGNGGNAGDLDLAITLEEIHETFQKLGNKYTRLCTCREEVAENKLCGVLRALSKEQVSFCRETLISNRQALLKLTAKDADISYTWSDEPLTVRENGGNERIVDAITQNKKREIIIDRKRFLDMPPSFRMALLTHELFHLAGFEEEKGLLDTLGAATALAANDMDIVSDFTHLENVSRAYKPFIVQFASKRILHTYDAAKKLLKNKTSQSGAALFEYKPENFGYRLGFESVRNTSKYRNTISINESQHLYSLGIGYHWFPISLRLSRWSESHVSLFTDIMLGPAYYRVSDDQLVLKDKSEVLGVQAALQLHIPLIYGFWGMMGYESRYLQYRYKTLDIQINELQQVLSFGGVYAF